MPRYDLHAHLLPGVDDGPRTMQEAIEMVRVAGADGTEAIVATPHQRDVMNNSSVQRVRDLIAELNGQLRSAGPLAQRAPRVLLGMENHIEPELPEWLADGRAITLNETRFVLAEPPFTLYPPFVEEVLFKLQVSRLVPVIAHPERNIEFQRRPGKLRRLIERGMFAQLTGGSLLGEFGPQARRAAELFLRHGLVQMVASDMHRPSGSRLPFLAAAYARAVELVGVDTARRLFEDNPRTVLDGREPETDTSGAPLTRRRWFWPFGRNRESF